MGPARAQTGGKVPRDEWLLGLLFVAVIAVIWFEYDRMDWFPRSHSSAGPGGATAEADRGTVTTHLAPRAIASEASDVERVSLSSESEDAAAEPSLRPDEGLLRVQVLAAETAEPLTGVPMALRPLEGDWRSESVGRSRGSADEELLTDGDGRCEYLIPAGRAFVLTVNTFEQRDLESQVASVAPLAGGERRSMKVRIATGRGAVWHGLAMDADTGRGLAGARIYVLANTSIGGAIGEPLSADTDGRFDVEVPGWSQRRVRVEAPEHASVQVELGPGAEEPSRPVLVRLERCGQLQLRVSNAAGATLSGVAVELSAQTSGLAGLDALASDEAEHWAGRTDEDGICPFTELPPRMPLTLELSSTDGLRRSIPDAILLQPGERASRSFVIDSGCTIEGLVADPEGVPIAGLELWLASQNLPGPYLEPRLEESLTGRVTSGEDGRFRFEQVPGGVWWIGPAPGGAMGRDPQQDVAPLALEVLIDEEERTHSLALTAWPAHSIRGRVVDSNGNSVANARVDAMARESGWRIESSADEMGAFVLGPFSSGLYELRALGTRDECASEIAVVREGTQDVLLRLRTEGSIRGLVVRADGARVAGAQLELFGTEVSKASIRSDVNGTFRFPALEPGRYQVVARTDGIEVGCQHELTVEAGATVETEIRLERGAELRLRVAARHGEWLAFRVRSQGLLVRAGSMKAGTEQFLAVPAGSVSVELSQAEGTGTPMVLGARDLKMEAGQQTLVEFSVP